MDKETQKLALICTLKYGSPTYIMPEWRTRQRILTWEHALTNGYYALQLVYKEYKKRIPELEPIIKTNSNWWKNYQDFLRKLDE